MNNNSPITRNIALLYDLAQLDIPVERVSSNLYRFTMNGAAWDYNPKRNTVKRVGTAKDIKAEPNVREWVKGKNEKVKLKTMSKIEDYKKEKYDHASMAEQAYKAMNEGKYKNSQRDKYGLTIGSKWHDHGEHMGYLTGHSGFYGSSGCTYECSPRLAHYLTIVINKRMKELVDEAIALSESDVEKKRIIAEDEAKSVLAETQHNS